MLAHATRLEVVSVLKSAPFVVMLAFAAINILMAVSFSERMFGTKVLPVTHLMLETLDSTYLFMLVIIVTFYAGEMIWRERKLKAADVYDALTTKRVYKPAMSHEDAAKIITEGAGTHFDPGIVEAFHAVEDAFRTVQRELNAPDS